MRTIERIRSLDHEQRETLEQIHERRQAGRRLLRRGAVEVLGGIVAVRDGCRTHIADRRGCTCGEPEETGHACDHMWAAGFALEVLAEAGGAPREAVRVVPILAGRSRRRAA